MTVVHPDKSYYRARWEHAWLLRAEGETLRAVGVRLGVSHERARQMIVKFSRIVSWALRHTRWPHK